MHYRNYCDFVFEPVDARDIIGEQVSRVKDGSNKRDKDRFVGIKAEDRVDELELQARNAEVRMDEELAALVHEPYVSLIFHAP